MRYVPTGSSAAGGFGSVIFCHDANLDRQVAVKFIQASGEHRRLLDELAALQQIRSKHVVEIFDVAHFGPRSEMGIVMEYIDGSELTALSGTVAPDNQFLRLLFQMASGLADIHAVDVVHRDIKPSNILVDAEGILKIIDFNLARPADESRTSGFVGTRGYAAPELYVDGDVEFNNKIDVYAFAITAYALLCGQPLPDELRARPPRPSQWKAAGGGFSSLPFPLDRELVRLLDNALDEDPALRPTASEILSRVERLLLHGRHRALFTNEAGHKFELHNGQPRVAFKHRAGLGALSIVYDSLDFRVQTVSGEVWVNNIRPSPGALLPACCVIGLGDPSRKAWDRMFITMDLSHPEVVL